MKVFTIDANMYEVRIDPNRWATVAPTPEGWHILTSSPDRRPRVPRTEVLSGSHFIESRPPQPKPRLLLRRLHAL